MAIIYGTNTPDQIFGSRDADQIFGWADAGVSGPPGPFSDSDNLFGGSGNDVLRRQWW